MTTETKTFIDFADIIAVEMRCLECETTTSRTLEVFRSATYDCPNCGKPVIVAQQTDAVALVNFVKALKSVQGIAPSNKLRLEIKQPSVL